MELEPINFELEGRTVVLGVGSGFWGDDSAGLEAVEKAKKQINSP